MVGIFALVWLADHLPAFKDTNLAGSMKALGWNPLNTSLGCGARVGRLVPMISH